MLIDGQNSGESIDRWGWMPPPGSIMTPYRINGGVGPGAPSSI
jgi:hypothetical protein